MNAKLWKKPSRAGFTIIELLMGALIMSMIGTLTYGAMWGTFKTQKTVDEKSDLQETGTALIHKIRDDLIQTFHVESNKPLTQFKGEDNGTQDKISFTALAHYPSQKDARESDQTEITYQIDRNPENQNTFILKRRESSFISTRQDQDLAKGEFMTLASNILSFNIDYFDGQKYRKSWDIRSQDQFNKLPKLVRVNIKLLDTRGRELAFQAIADLPLSESLSIEAAKPTTQNSSNSQNNNSNQGSQNAPSN